MLVSWTSAACVSSIVLHLPEGYVVIALRLRNLLRLAHRVGLGTEVGSGRAGLGKIPSKSRLEERSENELGAARELSAHEISQWHHGSYLKAGSDNQSKKTNLNV